MSAPGEGADDDRLTRLELRFMQQQDLLETLNDELTKAVDMQAVLIRRVERVEQSLQEVLRVLDVPANEKPPHY